MSKLPFKRQTLTSSKTARQGGAVLVLLSSSIWVWGDKLVRYNLTLAPSLLLDNRADWLHSGENGEEMDKSFHTGNSMKRNDQGRAKYRLDLACQLTECSPQLLHRFAWVSLACSYLGQTMPHPSCAHQQHCPGPSRHAKFPGRAAPATTAAV